MRSITSRIYDVLKDWIIDVFKIDVEGANRRVLYCCKELSKEKRIKRIFFEQKNICIPEFEIEVDDAQDFPGSLGSAYVLCRD